MVTHAYPRWEGDVAGAFIARLAEALIAGDHTVAVVAPADRGNARRFTLNGVDVVQVRYADAERENLAYTGAMTSSALTPSGFLAFLSLVGALAAGAEGEARRLQADVVHAHWWIPGGWAATRPGTRTPSVVTLHGTDVALLRGVPARLLGRRVLGRARCVTAVSTYLASEARRRTWRPRLPIDVVPLPIETAAFARRSGGGGGIAVLGRLTRQKRIDLLLRTMHGRRIAAPVTVVGDGPARAELERLAARLGLAQVRFVGAVPPARVPEALGDADVLAFLARHEGLGLAAAEALMLGIPVVAATDGGGVLDIVRDGAAGRVVPPGPDAVAAALQSLLGNAAARDAAHREGEALRARLSPAAVAHRFEEVYRRCA